MRLILYATVILVLALKPNFGFAATKDERLKADEIEQAYADTQEEAEKEKRRQVLKDKIACYNKRLWAVIRYQVEVDRLIIEKNQKLISSKTYSACMELHQREPEYTILNPICRDVFRENFHPDLDFGIYAQARDELEIARAENDRIKATLEEELIGLSENAEPTTSAIDDSLSDYREAINMCK